MSLKHIAMHGLKATEMSGRRKCWQGLPRITGGTQMGCLVQQQLLQPRLDAPIVH
jgi:hypothetical protein